jgi:hypothetical protein
VELVFPDDRDFRRIRERIFESVAKPIGHGVTQDDNCRRWRDRLGFRVGLARRRSARIVYRRLLLGVLVSVASAEESSEESAAAARPLTLPLAAEKRKALVAKELRLRGRWQDNINGGDAGETRSRQKGRSDDTARNLVSANHAQPDARSPAERANLNDPWTNSARKMSTQRSTKYHR